MYAFKQHAIGVKYYNEAGRTEGGKTYYYLLPVSILLSSLKLFGHVVVVSAMTQKPEVCEIVDLNPSPAHGAKATKEIIGTADLTFHVESKAREARKAELIRQLALRERDLLADPMVRYARLAQADVEAARLYAELASL